MTKQLKPLTYLIWTLVMWFAFLISWKSGDPLLAACAFVLMVIDAAVFLVTLFQHGGHLT